MTKKEIEEIKSLLVGLAGISKFQSTGKRVDKMLAVLEKELSKLHQPTVSGEFCECIEEYDLHRPLGGTTEYCTNCGLKSK
jgi:hypothetical protein